MLIGILQIKYNISYLMLLPLTLSWSRVTGSLFLMVILTVFRWVFIATSTPVMVPCTYNNNCRKPLSLANTVIPFEMILGMQSQTFVSRE